MPDAAEQTRTFWPWVVLPALLALAAVLGLPLALLGLPAPMLFAALAVGLGCALLAPRVPRTPPVVFRFGQAVLGAAIGATLRPGLITSLRADWFPALAACAATLLLSVSAGYLLRIRPGISATTSGFAMVAGGFRGIGAIARDLGADDRVVTVVQYLRVLIILLAIPLVEQTVFHPAVIRPVLDAEVFELGEGDSPPPLFVPDFSAMPADINWVGVAGAALVLLIGLALARLIPFPAGALLFPLIVAAALAGTGAIEVSVPNTLRDLGFALIGLQVGLRVPQADLRAVAGVLPLALALIIGMVMISAGFGVILAEVTGHSRLDSYLATTPGGLYAVLATAADSGADVTFVLMVQITRLFVILLGAPLLARLIAGRTG